MHLVEKTINALNRAESVFAAIGLILVAATLLADVAGRELFGSGIYWAPRTASYATTLAGMIAFSVVVSSGGHLRPKLLDEIFPDSWDLTINRIADIISAAICAFLAWHGAMFVHSTFVIGTRAIALEIPVWYIQLVLPYVFTSAALRYVAYAVYPELRPDQKSLGE
jgi:C4-dicarboxylate transporter DctQ subunit